MEKVEKEALEAKGQQEPTPRGQKAAGELAVTRNGTNRPLPPSLSEHLL